MQDVLKMRQKIFEETLDYGENRKNWEMLCCCDNPLVPFLGAGISAWCYPTWKKLLIDIVREVYSEKCVDYVNDAWECTEIPSINEKSRDRFVWTEEIAECIFDANEKAYKNYVEEFSLIGEPDKDSDANDILQRLRDYVGDESVSKKQDAVKALYKKFDDALLKENGKIPEYQSYFPVLFPDILVTTNYDNALECSYSSILSYSYMDLKKISKSKKDKDKNKKRSWLYRAVLEKLRYMRSKSSARDIIPRSKVTVPDMPMLLKVHGSIKRADDIALTKRGYDKAYRSEIQDLMKEIFRQSTLIFMGYGLARDRIMGLLEEQKNAHPDMKHFAFLSLEHSAEREELEKYNIYPIYYDKQKLKDMFPSDNERHDYFLGLLLENLARRTKGYPQPLEMLWEKDRYKNKEKLKPEIVYNEEDEQFVRREEALQIWEMLDISEECPLIAIMGEQGSGKSTLCQNLQKLQKGHSNAMQFFYVPIARCKNWDEFCIRIYQELNIVELEIPEINDWRKFAEKITNRCTVYWRSVLVLDCLDDLKSADKNQEVWETVKKVLKYWKEHRTRIVFSCQEYPRGLPCHTWKLGKLGKEGATKVFFSACMAGNGKNVTYLEKKVVSELFAGQELWPSSIHLLGRYASSKSDLTSFLEEWDFYHKPGDKGEQTVARMLWHHLLDGHIYRDLAERNIEEDDVPRNILWLWGILGIYPGILPSEFFEALYEHEKEHSTGIVGHKRRELTENTLMFMKNIGLCVEKDEEKQNILLENIVDCVRNNFISKLDSSIVDEASFMDELEKGKGDSGEDVYRLECFRGYLMNDWESSLRKYVLAEMPERIWDVMGDPMEDTLEILEILGNRVKDNDGRAKNRKLNLVLHYEVKTVISFLWMYLPEVDKKKRNRIAEVGYCFSHYYHYMPNYAYPLVKQLLQLMRDKEVEIDLYKVAEMSRVMGDIQRLMGRRAAATEYYHQAIDLCHRQILEVMDLVSDSDETSKRKKIYDESCRVKAGVLLIQNYALNIDEADNNELDESRKIYAALRDDYGVAYYHQRMGELHYSEAESHNRLDKDTYDKIMSYYQKAAELFEKRKDETGSAYICKCKGDLIVKFREGCKIDAWREKAAKLYCQAFMHYYNNINWRGFANVMQAMETYLRYCKDPEDKVPITSLYDLAEECYRWLGDTRGLSDTLDYAGYELKESDEELHKYMALGKWIESRELWKKQENKAKVEKAENEISNLRKNLAKNTGEKNGKE